MVTLRAELVPVPAGAPVLLFGVADGMHGGVAAVKLEDGRELLIASRDLTVETPRATFFDGEWEVVSA